MNQLRWLPSLEQDESYLDSLPIDVVAQICASLDDESLRTLSRTRLWLLVRQFATSELFWKARLENYLAIDLSVLSGSGWRQAHQFCTGDVPIPNLLVVDILTYTCFDFSRSNYRCLRDSAREGNFEVVRELYLWTPGLDQLPARLVSTILNNAILSKNPETIEFLINQSRTWPILSLEAVIDCDYETMKLIIELTKDVARPIAEISGLIKLNIASNRPEIVQLLLSSYPKQCREIDLIFLSIVTFRERKYDLAALLFINSRCGLMIVIFWILTYMASSVRSS